MGIQFIMDTQGNQFIEWDAINPDDIVIIPAFGTTLEIVALLEKKGVDLKRYDTTCPFVTKVWKQSEKLGSLGATVIIHGKHLHEETRATFSHSTENAPSLVVKDMEEAKLVGAYILGELNESSFKDYFKNYSSKTFDPKIHLQKIGVVNQTTMLASDTQAIADYFKEVMLKKYGANNIANHFSDSRDTLCYATNDNQQATIRLLEEKADLAIVVGGFNSSNTSHLVELCEEKLATYFVSSADEIISREKIRHFNYQKKQLLVSENYLPQKKPLKIILTSGASCPDVIVDGVIDRLLSFFELSKSKETVLNELNY